MPRGTWTGRRSGFTILELLIVVVLISVLAAMAMGRTGKMLTGWRVNRAAQTMSEELQKAFALVGRNRKPLIIHYNDTTQLLTMKSRSDTVFSRRAFGPFSEYKLDSAAVEFSNTKLEVYPPGLAADSLSIVITKNGASRRVRMLRGGLVQICKSAEKNKCIL